jgi:hypothetical protein
VTKGQINTGVRGQTRSGGHGVCLSMSRRCTDNGGFGRLAPGLVALTPF